MTPEHSQASAPESRLQEVLLAYIEAVEAGQEPDRDRLLAENPELAEELGEFFAGQDQVNRIVGNRESGVGNRGSETSASDSRLPTPDTRPIGELGDFRLLREVGRGGMGVVYEAEQISLHRRVALKVLPFAAALDPRQLQRFHIEAQAAAQLHHTNIVPVFAVGSERGVHYYAMQFIEGQSLAALIGELREQTGVGSPKSEVRSPKSGVRSGEPEIRSRQSAIRTPLSAPPTVDALISSTRSTRPREFFMAVARLGKQAADALEHAHQMGVVHRDIKPGNLMLDQVGQVWVTDFGLAQFRSDTELTATGEVLGTLRYASPEQARARPGVVDQRSDIYALGATLYELLTLHPVFNGKDRGELLRQITFEEPSSPRSLNRGIPIELETIVLKALAKSATDRYATARELADDLQRFIDDKPILARRPSWAERAAKWSRRHRPVVYSVVTLLLMGMVALSVSTVLIAGAYTNERLKAEEARKAQARAEESYKDAKRAVDLLMQLSEEELPGFLPLEGVRRKMLDAALEFYQKFLEQHQGNASIQPELAASHARVARLLAELSASQGYARMRYLDDHHVQEDLDATREQSERIRFLNGKFADKCRALGNLPPETRQTEWAKLARDHEKELANVLDESQRLRLQQISFQFRSLGPYGLRDPEIVKELKLAASQQQEIRRIQEESMVSFLVGGPKDGFGKKGGKDGGFGKKGGMDGGGKKKDGPGWPPSEPPDRVLLRQMLEVLTVEQKRHWAELTGEPFHGPPPGGPWIGPGFGRIQKK